MVADNTWDEMTITIDNNPSDSTLRASWSHGDDIKLDVTDVLLDALGTDDKLSIRTHDCRRLRLVSLMACLALAGQIGVSAETDRPNILWIVSEDNSPLLGCYGDTFATTPNLDALAKEGILYRHAFANAPVCASTRSTLISGMYACGLGTEQMRSSYQFPSFVKTYPMYLKETGYYIANHRKTDYNSRSAKPKWDGSETKLPYGALVEKQPFFRIENLGTSHESSMHTVYDKKSLKHKSEKVTLPPYHPDIPEMRHGWAQYYDIVTKLDNEVGQILEGLKRSGLDKNTIVFYYSDHGGVIARSKRFLYQSGTHIPMIVRVPEKYRHFAPSGAGSESNRLVAHVDLPPTLLSLAGIPVPDYFQGKAFLGKQKTEDPEYAYMYRGRMDERYDLSRSLRSLKYRYTRHYMPHRPFGQYLDYLWRAEPTGAWEKAYKAGRCNAAQSAFWKPKPFEEFFEVEEDPHEVNNLASDPKYKDLLDVHRQACDDWQMDIKDAGFLPEGMKARIDAETPIYDWIREEGNYPLKEIMAMAGMAGQRDKGNLEALTEGMSADDDIVRYWATMGCLILGGDAGPAKSQLLKMLKDDVIDTRVAAAEALVLIGEKKAGVNGLISVIGNDGDANGWEKLNALNAIDELGDDAKAARPALEILGKADMKYQDRVLEAILKLGR